MIVVFITSSNTIDVDSYYRLMDIYRNDDEFVTDLLMSKFNYKKKIEIEESYKDCCFADFNEDLTFSIDKYNARKENENNQFKVATIKARLEQLSHDIVQTLAGAEIEDIEERQKEFQSLHNELRCLLGKQPRKYN